MGDKEIYTASFIKDFKKVADERIQQEKIGWIKDLKKNSLNRFESIGVPTVKDEEWKYTNLSSITNQKFDVNGQAQLKEQKSFEEYCADSPIRITFINGQFSEENSRLKDLPKGLTILPLAKAVNTHGEKIKSLLSKYSTSESTSFVALNTALTDNGVFVEIASNSIVPEYIHIVHVTSSSNGEALSFPRTIILSGKSSEATILESHIAFNREIVYFTNALTDIHLEENATLHYYKAQHESLKAFHINTTRVWQERNSNFNSLGLMTGSALNRNNLDIVLNGEGINSTLDGLYCLYGQQHVDNHTSVDHRFPNCISNQLYKGVLNQSSRAVFNGKIFVKPIAQKTNSYQLNKNLLLGDKCRVDTKPQLEIFADDVRCTHGATIGQLDEDEMFYLQTRCIGREESRKMLVKGFVDVLINTVKDPAINRKLHSLLEPSFAQL
ncbi:MAG: Fe-S cluster assembly protein SufD [Candidatus Omnitrophica bacterium]|nr:Fe-S cluster assembly protein SufD [Candidatus Omnitrophota bacterium]